MEQVAILWGWIFSCLFAFFWGYWLRNRQSEKRRRLVREMRERNRAARDKVPANTET